jgi:hypothetical protein
MQHHLQLTGFSSFLHDTKKWWTIFCRKYQSMGFSLIVIITTEDTKIEMKQTRRESKQWESMRKTVVKIMLPKQYMLEPWHFGTEAQHSIRCLGAFHGNLPCVAHFGNQVTFCWPTNATITEDRVFPLGLTHMINSTVQQCSLFKSEWLSANIKLTLHKALIRSVITYACPAWEFVEENHLLKLQRMQNRVLRTIGSFPRHT